MLLSTLFVVPVIPAHATGQVNVNGGTEIVVPQSQTTVNVPINIQGSDALNGFDVQVVADPAVLSGASVSLSGSILPSPTIVIECINGILIAGTTCAPQDGVGVVHLGAVHVGSLVAAPVSGLLFTITYNVVGTSAGTPISFNTGCTGTSVPGDCVTVSNGTPTAVTETDLAGSFANLNDFSMTVPFTKLSSPAGTAITETISFAALGAFSATVNLSVTGPCTLAASSVALDSIFNPTGTDALTCSSTVAGDYPVTVTGNAPTAAVSHHIDIDFLVAAAGFSSSLSQDTVTIPKGTSDSSTIVTLTGVSGFSGTVAVTASCPTGITGSASPASVTLTHDASGYSSGTTTLTINVASSVADGVTYNCAVTGGSTLKVFVPSTDFSIGIVPTAESVPRGSSAAATINLQSLGSFAGTLTLTSTYVVNSIDAGTGVTNNINLGFLPSSVTLTAGGSAITSWFGGTVKIGFTPNPANTATGNYTATITATSGTIHHSVQINFLVQDFVLGPSFCSGNNIVYTTPNAENDPVFVGEQCTTFTLTTQTVAAGGAQAYLWVQVNSLGGLQTNGASGVPGIQGGDPNGPGRGTRVPELHRSVCFFATYFANGTRVPTSYLIANGPIVRADPFSGCRGFGEAFPTDIGMPICVPPDDPSLFDCVTANNVDFYQVSANALTNTKPGTYYVDVCGEIGTLINCQRVTLVVILPPFIHQFVMPSSVSYSASGGVVSGKVGITNPSGGVVYVQITLGGKGNAGDKVAFTSAIFKTNPGGNANNIPISIPLKKSMIGETFTYTSRILVGLDAGALTGTSTVLTLSATFTVTA